MIYLISSLKPPWTQDAEGIPGQSSSPSPWTTASDNQLCVSEDYQTYCNKRRLVQINDFNISLLFLCQAEIFAFAFFMNFAGSIEARFRRGFTNTRRALPCQRDLLSCRPLPTGAVGSLCQDYLLSVCALSTGFVRVSDCPGA